MEHTLVLSFAAIISALLIFAASSLFGVSLTGLFSPFPQEENITNETQHEEPITPEMTLQCPISCDDYNPCTFDWCNETSNYSCVHTNLTGDVEGCKSFISKCSKRTCVSGKCVTVEIEGCLEEVEEESTTMTQEVIQPTEEIQNVSETPEPEESITTLDHVIINEILTKSPLCSDNDKEGFEFIELYNPTSSSVSIGNWWIVYYTSTKTDWNDYTWRKQLPSDAQITPHSYYLIAVSIYWDNCTEKPDWIISPDYNLGYTAKNGKITASKGTVALHSSFGNVVDAVGWGDTKLYEGSPAIIEVGKSLQRKSPTTDTDNNLNDFIVSDSPTPQNSQS